MRRSLYIFVLIAVSFIPKLANAQFESFKDSVVQLYGVVMTSDSLVGIPAATIMLKGQNRGTISNDKGVFSIVVLKGDEVEITSVGYKPVLAKIPSDLVGNQYSLVQLMTTDTVYLPATIIRSRPTREQFERDFLNTQIPDDDIAVARKSTNEETRRFLMATMPADGREATNAYLRGYANRASYAGQIAPQNIFNPMAWAEFIKAWKRGDYKKKK